MSIEKCKQVILSLANKLIVLKRLDKDQYVQKIASELGVGITKVKDWRKNIKQLECQLMTRKD